MVSFSARTASARVCEKQNALLDRIYPVGSIYITVSDANPKGSLGGEWVEFAQGRTLIGVDKSKAGSADPLGGRLGDFRTSELLGGHETHKLTERQMPIHAHDAPAGFNPNGYNNYVQWANPGEAYINNRREFGKAGGDEPHNNLQPYIVVYMWRRTA